MKDRKGIFMFLKIVNGYGVWYAMVLTAAIGVLSRMYLSGIYRGLLKDLKRSGTPRRKLIQQMKKNYESCCRRNEEIKNMDSFISASLYNHRFFGMTMDGLKRISGQALFLCAVMGGTVWLMGESCGVRQSMREEYLVTTVVAVAVILDTIWLTDAGRKQELLEIAVLNYLQNRLPQEAWEKSREEEKAELVSEFRERRMERKLSREAETDIEYLKKSLQQIAAENEKGETEKPYTLTPAEGKLVEEILEGFLG